MNVRRIALAAFATVSCLCLAGRAQAQQRIVMQAGAIAGESTVVGLEGQIDLLAASFGGDNPACTGTGKGTMNLSQVNISKYIDKATVDLQTLIRDHIVTPVVNIRFVRPDNQVYQKYELDNAVFSSWSASGSDGAVKNTENFSISFSQVIVTYTFYDASGKNGGSESVTLVTAACPGP